MKLFLFSITVLFFSSYGVFAALDSMDCKWETNSCSSEYFAFFAGHKDYNDSLGNLLSSNVKILPDSNYNRVLCCKPLTGSVSVYNISASSDCSVGDSQLMYLTSSINARTAYEHSVSFDITDYAYKLCSKYSNDYSKLEIRVVDNVNEYNTYVNRLGYSCLYKTSSDVNGHVSSCEAKFDSTNSYNFSVIARLWENVNSLVCSSDCTSKLDDRVYSACGLKFEACAGINPACDGSILGSWVSVSDGSAEVECSAPWNNYRSKLFTDQSFKVTSTDNCQNIVNREYQVMLENELVTMHVYICGDK